MSLEGHQKKVSVFCVFWFRFAAPELWAPPKASHRRKASHPHFLRFAVCVFRIIRVFVRQTFPKESQTCSSKRALRDLKTWRVQGNPPTLCQPFANPSPTLCQPLGQPCGNPSPNLCQPFLSTPLQAPFSMGPTETRVNGFLVPH